MGDVVELFWKTDDAQRALPAEITEVEQVAVIRSPTRATVRPRSASAVGVRGRVTVPVTAGYGSIQLTGETVDLSEAGLRAESAGLGAPPVSGPQGRPEGRAGGRPRLSRKAEVVRTQAPRRPRIISIRSLDLQEKDQDRVRRCVLQALREERARTPPTMRRPASGGNSTVRGAVLPG